MITSSIAPNRARRSATPSSIRSIAARSVTNTSALDAPEAFRSAAIAASRSSRRAARTKSLPGARRRA